jgi:hypothetical protein
MTAISEAATRNMGIRPANPTFREGDEVVLANGTYQGTMGVFLRLKEDANWADISERDGDVRSHPVVWLAHSAGAIPGSAN